MYCGDMHCDSVKPLWGSVRCGVLAGSVVATWQAVPPLVRRVVRGQAARFSIYLSIYLVRYV